LTSAVGPAIEPLLILQMADAHFRRGSASTSLVWLWNFALQHGI